MSLLDYFFFIMKKKTPDTLVWSNKTAITGKNHINYTLDVLRSTNDSNEQHIISEPAKCIAVRGAHSAKLKQ